MKLIDNYSNLKLFLISLLGAVIVAYPNLICLPWEFTFLDESVHTIHLFYLALRYLIFVLLFCALLYLNIRKKCMIELKPRLFYTFMIAVPVYLAYILFSFSKDHRTDFPSTITCQFFVIAITSVFAGHISMLYQKQRNSEQEIENLKLENLQSRYDALTNQINPHFFFNSLNGLSGLIRKKDDTKTLEYVTKLSDVFRYILQSDKKGVVCLKEELEFVQAFRYMMEVRFANKLIFDIQVDEKNKELKLPVLSLLPLIDNVVVHNIIDSNHLMTISISLNEKMELVVANPKYPKLTLPDTNGTGLKNVINRFDLLMKKQVRVEDNAHTFIVYLPLK